METDYYNDPRYTNEKGYQDYCDKWASAKVIALIAFFLVFAFA